MICRSLLSPPLHLIFMKAENNMKNFKKLYDGWIKNETKPTYHGWPSMIITESGELLAVCSGNRLSHVCPYGRVFLYRSSDCGRTWSGPEFLTSGPLDDRDAGIIVDSDGSLLLNYFTSIAFFEHDLYVYPHIRHLTKLWEPLEEKITLAELKCEHGFFMKRSTDGKNWSDKFRVPVNNVHGPMLLNDGTLFWIGKEQDPSFCSESRMGKNLIAAKSTDHGNTWETISTIPVPPGQKPELWHEAHSVQAADGTIIIQFRNHNVEETVDYFTWQCESADGGCTWTTPHPITYGFPSHLLKLADGRLLMSYSVRKEPFGIRVRFSNDNGKTWENEIILTDDAPNWDVGYPSTAELPDGSLFTLWYENRDELAQLRYLCWKI